MRSYIGGIFVFILPVLLAGCATTTRVSPEEQWEYVVTESPRLAADSLQSGALYYRDDRVPEYFSEIVIGARHFEYVIRSDDELFRGYRLSETRDAPVSPSVEDSISAGARRRGWYLGQLDELRAGTPDEWIWVRRETLSAWISPTSIDSFAEAHDLARMRRPVDEPRPALRVSIRIQQTFGGRRGQ